MITMIFRIIAVIKMIVVLIAMIIVVVFSHHPYHHRYAARFIFKAPDLKLISLHLFTLSTLATS